MEGSEDGEEEEKEEKKEFFENPEVKGNFTSYSTWSKGLYSGRDY